MDASREQENAKMHQTYKEVHPRFEYHRYYRDISAFGDLHAQSLHLHATKPFLTVLLKGGQANALCFMQVLSPDQVSVPIEDQAAMYMCSVWDLLCPAGESGVCACWCPHCSAALVLG